jgi:hypothetical protein
MAENTSDTRRHTAGLFDIRIIIAALLGLYGVILLITGFFTSDRQLARADGLNVNIVGGIAMVVVAVAFAAWARLRPTVVPADTPRDTDDRPPGH